jgi:hypothetical protein
MKNRALTTLPVAAATALGILSYVGALPAQTPRPAPAPRPTAAARPAATPMPTVSRLPVAAEPAALSPAARAARIKGALETAALTAAAPGSFGVRVTPAAPKTAAAEILGAGAVHFSGPRPGASGGEYAFGAGTGGGLSWPYVDLRLQTEANKHYVLDCRLRPPPGASTMGVVMGTPGGASATLEVKDGHVLFAFKATAASTDVNLVVTSLGGGSHRGYFYGCDVGKV